MSTATAAQTTEIAQYHSSDPSADFACSRFNVDVAGRAYKSQTTEANPGPNPSAVHPWERCGLGVAPYKLVGAGQMTYRATPDAPLQPGTCCDYCSQGIVNVYFIKAACGSTFKVGCDCVRRACSTKEGVRTAVEVQAKKLEAVKRGARNAAKKEELETFVSEQHDRLATMPHPRGFAGKTMLDYVEWMLKSCGAAGRAKLLKEVRTVLGG